MFSFGRVVPRSEEEEVRKSKKKDDGRYKTFARFPEMHDQNREREIERESEKKESK